MNKVVYIKAHPIPVGKDVQKKIATGEKKKGLFGGEKDITRTITEWEQTGWSDCKIDGERLTSDINEAVNHLNEHGYEVQSVLPIISGAYDFKYEYKESHGSGSTFEGGGFGYGYGYGYSYTEGVTIIARKSA
jgi:hypothetical protein